MQENPAIDPSPSHLSEIKDYFSLLKPRVMSLVVFTGFAGTYLAPGEIHPLITVVTVLCIALGSGAAGAINMYIEHEIDAKMNRTKHRPIPGKRMLPQSAIEFAAVFAFAAVFVMAFAVNFLSAALLLAAILYYVFIYTIWLKPRTPQNIVIGGAAGAFPPVIGWTAVTGSIALEPLLLFAIIFMWTPPHFWALSLYQADDYKKAGIPMLPVVSGEETTKQLMLLYTIILVPLTLTPYFIGMSGGIYVMGANLLSLLFVAFAIQVIKATDDKPARKMFAYSIFYLFAIFLLLIIDKAF